MTSSPRDSNLRGTLATDFRGIRIGFADRASATAPLVVHGVYRVPESDVRSFESPAVRALVLVVQHELSPEAAMPFAEHVLFEEDQVRTHAGVEGAFKLDVFEIFAIEPHDAAGHYDVFVSLGPHVSNVLEVDIPG